MTNKKDNPKQNRPLTPHTFHILMALVRGDKHGYGIILDIEESTGGNIRLGPGTLYGSIKRMLAAGWIAEIEERPDPTLDDERRRYYRLTDLGHRIAMSEAERLEGLVHLARDARLLTFA
jgi:DNA-binding PadR family transcriptional regulator